MENYYVTAVVTRPMGADAMKEICAAGRIYVSRVKAIVQAVSPADAIAPAPKKSPRNWTDLACTQAIMAVCRFAGRKSSETPKSMTAIQPPI